MSFDVQLWFAKDENNNIVTINEVNKEEKHTYHCPLCGSEVNPKQGKVNQWHFAHIDKSKCSSETMYHFWIKNKLLQKGDKFIVKSDKEREYICKEILVEKEIKIGDKEYRPDLTIITKSGETIYFEMNYSNEKKLEDYLDIWIELGNIVVEVDVKTLINSENIKIPTFKAKYYKGKCFSIKSKEDKIYYDIIGSYKEKLIKSKEYGKKKKEVEKLDWFWKDIQKYKMNEVNIEHLSRLIQSIESKNKELIIQILKRINCNNVIEDYVEYRKEKLCKEINKTIKSIKNKEIVPYIQCKFKTPHCLYDRVYGMYDFDDIYYKNKKLHFYSPNADKDTILKKIYKVEDEIKKERNLKEEVNTFLLKNKDLKENIRIQDKQIKLINFYRNRDFEFTIENWQNETQVHYKVYLKKSIEREKTICFYKDNYKKVFNYINNQVINIVDKKANSIGINFKTNVSKKIKRNGNIVLDLLSDIISNDNKRVKKYNMYYNLNDGCLKYIFFKDYKNKFFLICNKDDLNEDEIQEIVKNNEYKIINIKNLSPDRNYILYESKLTYKIKRPVSLQYKYNNYLGFKKLYLSFNKKDKDYIYLSRYNFVKATELLENIKEEIESFLNNKINECKIINPEDVYSEKLNNKVKQIIYPIINAKRKNQEDILKIKLNINFTRNECGKFEPWIIKNFIEELNELFQYSIRIENII